MAKCSRRLRRCPPTLVRSRMLGALDERARRRDACACGEPRHNENDNVLGLRSCGIWESVLVAMSSIESVSTACAALLTSTHASGLIGLAVMGENLVLNMANHGFTVAVYNRTTSKVTAFLESRAKGKSILGAMSEKELVAQLKAPRKVMIMVQAGGPVDAVIEGLVYVARLVVACFAC